MSTAHLSILRLVLGWVPECIALFIFLGVLWGGGHGQFTEGDTA